VLLDKKKDAKYEWTLHHFLAVSLILFSCYTNLIKIAVLVLVIHDLGDIILAGGRAYGEMKFKNNYLLSLLSVN
jgi:ceramide synthetase